MPMTGETGFNADMPAIWIMNAKIALTSQYGENQQCSCWSRGCGEIDVFEVLDTGNTRCKSTLYMAPADGSSDYFERQAANHLASPERRPLQRSTIEFYIAEFVLHFH